LLSVGFEPVNDIEFHWYDLDFCEGMERLNVLAGTRQRKGAFLVLKLLQMNTRPKMRPFSLRFKYESIFFLSPARLTGLLV
jgi:hypothetical protein